MKTFENCKKEVAIKYKLGKTLVGGHLPKYWEEAAMLYSEQFKTDKDKLQACYNEIWKTQIYSISMKDKPLADDILKREFPFLTCNTWEENHK